MVALEQTLRDLLLGKEQPTTLRVRVTPKAKSARIKLEHAEDGGIVCKIYVTVAPEDGKANKAVIALLAEALDLPKSSLIITHGLTNRDKTIEIKAMTT